MWGAGHFELREGAKLSMAPMYFKTAEWVVPLGDVFF
jgi:hypothetical protein